MNFAEAMRENGKFTRTENGAVALSTTGDARLDLFGTIGSLREADENRITTLFAEAYAQDKLFATKIAFYARDIRSGLGERKTFRTIIRYMAEKHPEALRPNLDLVGVFGRYDDLFFGTVETVKCMEKFFLCGFFSYNKLNIIDEKNVNIPVFFTEFAHCRIISVSDGFDQFICEFLTGYIENPAVFVVFQYKMSDGMHKMRFSETGSAVNKQRIIGISW